MLASPLLRGSPVKAGARPVTFICASADGLLPSDEAGGSSSGRLIETLFLGDAGGFKEEVASGLGDGLEWPSGSTTLTSLEPSPPLAEVGFSDFGILALDGARVTRFIDPLSTEAVAAVLRFAKGFCFAGETAAA